MTTWTQAERILQEGIFRVWVAKQEHDGLGWTAGLPVVPNPLPHRHQYKTVWTYRRVKIGWFWVNLPYYYKVELPGGIPYNHDYFKWTDPKVHSNDDFTNKYHIGAVWELRSRPIANGAGQQACYDAGFNLITNPPGCGTKDKKSPCAKYIGTYNVVNLAAHAIADVVPFELAYALDDGNIHGENVAIYMKHRPPSV